MTLLRRDEGGAVAVIVAIFMAFAVLGLAAVSIDLGSLWQSQRSMVTGTDAMALGGAQVLGIEIECDARTVTPSSHPNVKSNDDVYQRVLQVANDNEIQESDIESVDVRCEPNRKIVEVRAREASPGWFSGSDDLSALGVSTAVKHQATFSGLAFCQQLVGEDFDDPLLDVDEIDEFRDEFPWSPGDGAAALDGLIGTSSYPSEQFVEMPYGVNFAGNQNGWPDAKVELYDNLCPMHDGSENPYGSGTIPGGWGWLEDADWSPDDEYYCEPGSLGGTWCKSDTGTNEMNSWNVARGDDFNFPVFDMADGQGAGGQFQVVGIGQAMLIGCSQNPNNDPDWRADGGDAPFVGTCAANRDYISLYMIGYSDLDGEDEDEVTSLVNPASRICGVRGNDGECL